MSGRRSDDKTTGIGFVHPSNFHENECDADDDWEQTLSFLPTPMQDIMYYELKSRTPNTNRYVAPRLRSILLGKFPSFFAACRLARNYRSLMLWRTAYAALVLLAIDSKCFRSSLFLLCALPPRFTSVQLDSFRPDSTRLESRPTAASLCTFPPLLDRRCHRDERARNVTTRRFPVENSLFCPETSKPEPVTLPCS